MAVPYGVDTPMTTLATRPRTTPRRRAGRRMYPAPRGVGAPKVMGFAGSDTGLTERNHELRGIESMRHPGCQHHPYGSTIFVELLPGPRKLERSATELSTMRGNRRAGNFPHRGAIERRLFFSFFLDFFFSLPFHHSHPQPYSHGMLRVTSD